MTSQNFYKSSDVFGTNSNFNKKKQARNASHSQKAGVASSPQIDMINKSLDLNFENDYKKQFLMNSNRKDRKEINNMLHSGNYKKLKLKFNSIIIENLNAATKQSEQQDTNSNLIEDIQSLKGWLTKIGIKNYKINLHKRHLF